MPNTIIRDQSFEIAELDAPFNFSRRPIDIPGDLRPVWRIGLLVLLLKNCCRQNRARFTQLHVLNWGIRSDDTRRCLEEAISGSIGVESLIVRIEPSLNRAVDLAIGERLVRRCSGDQVELTQQGLDFASEIENDALMYRPERDFMARIRKKVTATFVDGLFNKGV